MSIKKFLLLFTLFLFYPACASAQNSLGQTIQINTHLRSIIGKPTWLLIVRNVDSGVVLPYLFDLRNNDDFWVVFTFGRNYRVTVSTLKFGAYAVIHDFCHLEDGVLSGESMIVSVSGDLTPSPSSSDCHVLKYNGNDFPIVNE